MPTKTRELIFGPYHVLERLGQGAQSRVFKARHHDTGTVVALKVGWKRNFRDNLIKKFEAEYELGSRLHHANLVDVIDFGMDGSYPYLATEYVEGPTLQSYIAGKGRLLEKEATRIAVQIAGALHYLHKKGISHREVNPAKVLIKYDGRAKLINAAPVQLDTEGDLARSGGFARNLFTAPELLEEPGLLDPRTDVYSLAMCLYQAVTGELPWDQPESMWSGQRLVLPSERVRDLGFRIDFALRQALQRMPELRVGNCEDFIKMLTTRSEFESPHTPLKLPPVVAARQAARVAAKKDKGWSQADRRVTLRYQIDSETQCQPYYERSNGNWKGFFQDISLTGVCLRLYRRFEVGTLLRMDFREGGSHLVRVRRLQEKGPRAWLLGCSFLKPLATSELQAFLESPIRAVGPVQE